MPYLTVNNASLYYEDDGAGQPLLFVHGSGTSGQVWGAQQREFVADHRVVVPDRRGCGRSARPAAGNTMDGLVADLAELIRALDLHRPVVIGSSSGSTYAIELALRHPDLLGGVVAVDNSGHFAAENMDLDAVWARLQQDRAGFYAGWVPNWFAPGTSPALIDWTVRQILDSSIFAEEHLRDFTTYDPRPALPTMRVPLQYLHGELDAEIPVSVPYACAALAPGAGVVVVPGAGHICQQDHPAAFNAALRTALARITTAAAPRG